jgi:hypothetical protein
MRVYLPLLVALLIPCGYGKAAEVLIVADEFPAMQVLARRLGAEENTTSQIVDQGHLPSTLAQFRAVVVYIHKTLAPAAERACIDYAEAGGRLVLLHHSISSSKRQNRDWFTFLGVELPEGDVEQGGYKWIEGVSVEWVNRAPAHYVMTNKVTYTETANTGRSEATANKLPVFKLTETEVYLNHVLHGPHTILMGLAYTDSKSGKTWIQDTAGWFRREGKGVVVYFMPGHTQHDFENPAYGRIVVNAITANAAVFR